MNNCECFDIDNYFMTYLKLSKICLKVIKDKNS